MKLFLIMIGGSVGAAARYLIHSGTGRWLGPQFPYGTLIVNVAGCFFMGLLSIILVSRLEMSDMWRQAILIGVLGAFTTFSAFSMETIQLLESGALTRGLLNIVLNVLLCLLALWMGMLLARQF